MRYLALLLLIITVACSDSKSPFDNIDIQGHRGARGLFPENTTYGFIEALKLGVNTLEMDLAVTADSQLVVSHEPFMSSEICLNTNGEEIAEADQMLINIYWMKYDELLAFDCGTKVHSRFPNQEKRAAVKPRLEDVIDEVEAYTLQNKLAAVNYNIEIKSLPEGDNTFHPVPSVFSDIVYNFIEGKLDWNRVTIQSFDFRVLQYFHENYPKVQLALLIENELPWKVNIDSLGFTPQIYSCDFTLLQKNTIAELKTAGMRVIPWTVNERADMDRLLDWGVDGLITDYPDRTK